MAEALVSAADSAVKELAAYIDRLRFSSSSSPPSSTRTTHHAGNLGEMIHESIDRLRRTLVRIQARLNDAEEMEIRDESVRLWLRELEGVAFAAEDVLDELTPVLRVGEREVQGGAMSPFVLTAMERIEAVHSRFYEITQEMVVLRLGESFGRRRVEAPARQPSSSLVRESYVFGRDEDLKAIKKLLLDAEFSSRTENISVIGIVGMGGLGKTTVAQLVYNEESVKMHFDMRLWISVSENFDLIRLTRAMLESSTQKPCHLEELNTLHVMLKEEMDRKRFLLVLDDVWEEENLSTKWDTLTAPLINGSKGSKIIITTRSEKVSKMARATSIYHLPCLQDGHCMELFSRWAFEDQDPYSLPNLMSIGKRISMKCKGLPLAAKTLGGLLCGEDDEQQWNNVLECDIWDMGEENGIMPILQLSYLHLPPHLKKCFRYCSVFPKDYEFDKDRLVWMWMAQGYVQVKGRKQMEDIGKEYFDDLLRRSFFQYSQEPNIFLMHDLIHDLARSVSRDECCSVESDKCCSIPRNVRHISIVLCKDPSSTASPGQICDPRTIRSLLFTSLFGRIFLMKPLNDLVTPMKQLRVLDFGCVDLEHLPNSIGCLKHLRYLGLRSNSIRQLPTSMGSLYHLQTLDLESSGVEFLPDSISDLVNLRHIICEHGFEYMPGIGKLINLRTMPDFHVSRRLGCAKLGELKDIKNIQSLGISRIANLTEVDEAKKACLEKKEQLSALDLTWDYPCPSSIDNEVLESLKPNPKLKRLKISYFMGGSVPSWLGHTSFSNLGIVELIKCQNWTSLPPLGKLPSLKCLSIESAKQVEYIGREFFSGGFQQLETLKLKDMDNLKSWCGAQRGECGQLQKLTIFYCKHLTSLSVINLDALQDLDIRGCSELQFSLDSILQLWRLPSLHNIVISHRWEKKYIQGAISHGGIQSPETSWLKLKNVSQFEAWSAAAWSEYSHICRLTVSSCPNLSSLHLGSLSSLQYLEIDHCEDVQSLSLNNLNFLQYLEINDCDNLQSLSLGNLKSLRHLKINHCDNLQSLCLGNLNSLRHLEIDHCDVLQSLSLDNLNSLEIMRISHCAQLQFSHENRLPSALQTFSINGCPFLRKWCQYNRQRLAHIRWLDIEGIDKHVVLQNVCSVQEAIDAYLGSLEKLLTLELVWDCDAGHEFFRDEEPEEVLKNLRPHNNVTKLVIQGYGGLRFANWLGDPSFINLKYVTLLSCSQCELLPPLGQLPILMELYIGEAHGLKCIGKELISSGCSTSGKLAFPSLVKLEFNDLLNWVEMEDGYLPCLCEFILKHCPMLKTLPHLPPYLREMEVVNCDVITLPQSLDHLSSLRTLRISQVPILKNLPGLPLGLRKLVLERLPALTVVVPPPSVRDLVLRGCNEAMVVATLPYLAFLTSLCISDFPELTTIPLHNLGILQELLVSNCPKLMTLDCFSFSPTLLEYTEGLQALKSLECLSISNCPKLHFSANERPPSALQSMVITNCPLAEPWHVKNWLNRTAANR